MKSFELPMDISQQSLRESFQEAGTLREGMAKRIIMDKYQYTQCSYPC